MIRRNLPGVCIANMLKIQSATVPSLFPKRPHPLHFTSCNLEKPNNKIAHNLFLSALMKSKQKILRNHPHS